MMITLKELFKLSFILLLLGTACSKEDDFYDHKLPKEIVGIWKPILMKDICPLKSDEIYYYSNCQQKATIEFLKDGNYKQKYHSFTETEECQLTFDYVGSWYVHKDNVLVIYRAIGFGFYQDYEFWEVTTNKLKLGDNSLYTCDGARGYVEYIRI